jgi:hypothetical protein
VIFVSIRLAEPRDLTIFQDIQLRAGRIFADFGMPEVAGNEPPPLTMFTKFQGEGRAWAADQGFPAVTLTTFTEVPWNGPYYQRCGFRFLDDDELTPGLRAIREYEATLGLDAWPRAAMRRDLS